MFAAYLVCQNDHLGITKACERAASVVGCNAQTVRRWLTSIATDNESDCEGVREKQNGPVWLLDGEAELQLMITQFIRENSVRKGEPNLTVSDVQKYVNANVLPLLGNRNLVVRRSTIYRWMTRLGFSVTKYKKGVYIDGHERDDVIKRRG